LLAQESASRAALPLHAAFMQKNPEFADLLLRDNGGVD